MALNLLSRNESSFTMADNASNDNTKFGYKDTIDNFIDNTADKYRPKIFNTFGILSFGNKSHHSTVEILVQFTFIKKTWMAAIKFVLITSQLLLKNLVV